MLTQAARIAAVLLSATIRTASMLSPGQLDHSPVWPFNG
jgi:hypothetical protein